MDQEPGGTMLDLMSALCAVMTSLDAVASELIEIGDLLDGEPVADMMRGLARQHHLDMALLRAQFAALFAEQTEMVGPHS